ncbi:MAG: 16S rRNA (adenine(1518)-N(6)/adenine(1519)-N(6))-dimethyltransferase RsmA [Dehalococcoidia bacterium]
MRWSHLPRTTRSPEPAARKALGQHFLRDSGVLSDIADAVRVPAGGLVLEVGPGTGQLTDVLLQRGHEVVAVEVEHRMIEYLERRFGPNPSLRLVEGDARILDLGPVIQGRSFVAVGNLPYFAANPIVRRFMEREPRPAEAVFMLQREVAREVCAAEGDFSLLTISVRVYADVEYLFAVKPEAFDPPPRVVSAVVRLVLRPEPLVPPERNAAFFELVSTTFRNPRKQVHNALSRGTWLPPEGARHALELAGIDPTRRAETLSIGEWLRLLDAVESERASA